MITVDFCRGSGGAFLAVNNLVVAGQANGDGSSRIIQSFEVEPRAMLAALQKAASERIPEQAQPTAIEIRGDAPSS